MERCVSLLLIFGLALLANGQTNGGEFIAVLASGGIDDFGYTNTVNQGRIYMERVMNISGSLFVDNINDEPTCTAVVDDLAAKGYKLIISTTSYHVDCALKAAQRYPDISFVQATGQPVPPNLSILSWSGPDQYYSAGAFCGAVTTKRRVGFVHPGPPLAGIQTLNAFYVGVKSTCSDCFVYSVYTDAFLNPDRTTGAANLLLAQDVDMLAGQQDDLTLINIAINHGFLAVGVSGFAVGDIYGQSVGVSVLRRWGVPFVQFATNALAGVYSTAIIESFAKDIALDTPSHLVSDEAWNSVLDQIVLLKQKTKPYFCSTWVAEFGLNQTTGCLQNNSRFSGSRLLGLVHLGTYHVPLTNVPFPEGAKIAIITISSILYIITAIIAIAVFFWHRDTVMLAASPTFMGLVLIGIAATFSAAIVWVSEPTYSTCSARIWLPSLGVTLSIGALIIKNIRLMIIFDAQIKRVKIRDIRLLMWVGCLILVDILLLALWSGLGDPHVDSPVGVDGLGTYEYHKICRTTRKGDYILYAIIAWHAAQLLVGCFVTFRIRVIDIEEFNESRPFGLSIYVVSLVYVIAGILVGTSMPTNKQLIIIVSLSFIIGCAAVIVLLFAPKFLTIFVKGNRPLEKFLNSAIRGSRTGSSGSGGTQSKSKETSSHGSDMSATTEGKTSAQVVAV